MENYSSVLAWRIPWTEEPGGLTVHGVAKSWTRLSDSHSIQPLEIADTTSLRVYFKFHRHLSSSEEVIWAWLPFPVPGRVVLELSDGGCIPTQLFTQALLLLFHKGKMGRSSTALKMQFLIFFERGHKESLVHGLFFPSQLKEVDLLLFTNLLSSLRQNMDELKKTNNGEQGGKEQNEK